MLGHTYRANFDLVEYILVVYLLVVLAYLQRAPLFRPQGTENIFFQHVHNLLRLTTIRKGVIFVSVNYRKPVINTK